MKEKKKWLLISFVIFIMIGTSFSFIFYGFSGVTESIRYNGLKFVRNIVTQKSFGLFFQTGDAFLNLDANNADVKIEETSEFMRGCLAVVKY